MVDLKFADDIALLSEEATCIQALVGNVVNESRKMEMRLNASKTEIQCLGKNYQQFQVQADGQQLQQTNDFVYLGGSISSDGGCESDISRRIGLARGIIQMLNKIWSSGAMSKITKVSVYI